jgi:alpha-galactosidase
LGKPGYRVSKDGDKEVWVRQMEDGSHAVGLFNRGENETKVTANWTDIGISGEQKVRDLWRQKEMGSFKDKFSASVGRHGVMLIRMWSMAKK